MSHLRNAFIDARKRWGGNGSGSTSERTSSLVGALPSLLERHKVRRVIDLGCGEVSWIAPIAAQLDSYLGVDVVPWAIESNLRAFPALSFKLIAGPGDPLPPADLVICRDCLAHLPTGHALAVIAQARAAAPLVLLTSNPIVSSNHDLFTAGGYRPLNLRRRPFDFPEPLEWVEDSDRKAMGLWRSA